MTEPRHVLGWHHHSDYDTYVYIITDRLRLESGPGGKDIAEAGPGDVVHVPEHTIHRESNPGSEMQVLFGVRVGTGEPVFNVEGPEEQAPVFPMDLTYHENMGEYFQDLDRGAQFQISRGYSGVYFPSESIGTVVRRSQMLGIDSKGIIREDASYL